MNRQLALTIFWIAVAVCAVAQLGIFHAAFARPLSAEKPETRPIPRSPRIIEIIWTVIPAVLLAGILAITWLAIR
jgi:heme/copper-type cytochrome/quinol oxidase subunit 2